MSTYAFEEGDLVTVVKEVDGMFFACLIDKDMICDGPYESLDVAKMNVHTEHSMVDEGLRYVDQW